MKYDPLRVALVLALAACNEDGSEDAETDFGRADAAAPARTDAGPSTSTPAGCKVPTGSFPVRAFVNVTGAGCSLPSNTVSRTFELDGTLSSFEESNCTAEASWEAGTKCVVRLEESCADGLETTTLVEISPYGVALSGTLSAMNGRCGSRGSFSGSIAPASGTSSGTDTTTPPTSSGEKLDVQLLYESGVDAGIGVYLEYRRYILRSNGQFEACEHRLAVGPNVQSSDRPKRSSGTYEISGSTIQLRDSQGVSMSLPFAYSAGSKQARIDGRLYEQEPQVLSSALICEF
jgi:hypothetical protein